MPPIHTITFVYVKITINIEVMATKERAVETALKILMQTVNNPLDYKIKQ